MHVVEVLEVLLRELVVVEEVDDGGGGVAGLRHERSHRPRQAREQVAAHDDVLRDGRGRRGHDGCGLGLVLPALRQQVLEVRLLPRLLRGPQHGDVPETCTSLSVWAARGRATSYVCKMYEMHTFLC